MRSSGRVATPQWSPDKSAEADESSHFGPIEIFWGKPMPGTATGRGPGKWGCIMISLRLALVSAGGSPLTEPSVPGRDPDGPWDRPELF
jgi:hypothetical protein